MVNTNRSWQQAMADPPRALSVVSRDTAGKAPFGHKRLSQRAYAAQVTPLVEEAIRGNVPLDAKLAEAVRQVAEQEHQQFKRGMNE